MTLPTRCTFEGCHRSTERPIAPGWAWLDNFPAPGIKDGYYCPRHVAAIEALDISGGLVVELDDEEADDDEEPDDDDDRD